MPRLANTFAYALAASAIVTITPISAHAAQTSANAPQSSPAPEVSPTPYSSEELKPDLLDGT
ncbi:MAG: hypothetical protein WAL67_01790, partial [Candidatus Cybelea sp.]